MRSIRPPVAAFAVAMLAWWVTPRPSRRKVPEPQEILRDWYYLMNELVRHTPTYSPPVASRSFGYLGVTAFEAAVGGSDRAGVAGRPVAGARLRSGARGRRRL